MVISNLHKGLFRIAETGFFICNYLSFDHPEIRVYLYCSCLLNIKMKSFFRFATTIVLLLAFLSQALPCGPGYTTPMFNNEKAPENPYSNFASGQLGIIKPGFRRSVLFAAYRYLNGGSFSANDQAALVELWKNEIDHSYKPQDDISEAVKGWVEKRKEVVSKEEKTPEIYVERTYGGYDFFPNCTKNAFETATETLNSRISSHGPNDPGVSNWVNGQDQVFNNCSSGKQTPSDPPAGSPDWLQKDRAYQRAAAEFYSLDYRSAKVHFAEIAQDTESPWAETADYLVARTLIRQASLTKSVASALPLYEEAEARLERFVSGGKFAASAERLLGLVKYRLHPEQRVSELAKTLSFRTGNENFKQDLIDYTWLLDKFESQVLEAEAKRKQALEDAKNGNANVGKEEPASTLADNKDDGDLKLTIYSESYAESWSVSVKPDATDMELLLAFERAVGKPLTEEQKKNARTAKESAYASRYTDSQRSDYEGGYYSDDKLELSQVPAFLRNDELSDWLFTFQTKTPEAYLYSLKRFKESGTDLWLMTALVKADKSSTDIPRLIEAANNANRTTPGYQTIAFHQARILIELGRNAEAKKIIEDMMNTGDELAISTRNSFLDLRRRIGETVDDFLTSSLRKAYGWDFSGSVGSIDELIAEQKSYYDPEYNKDGREAFNKEVEERYKDESMWQGREMFDAASIDLMNRTFPQSLLLEVEASKALPDHLRPKFALALWTRSYLLGDTPSLLKMTAGLSKYYPDLDPQLAKITAATTPAAQDRAALYFILKNPLMSPYIEDGIGKTDNEFGDWDSNDWWCSSYLPDWDESAGDESEIGYKRLDTPKFLSAAQRQEASAERKRIIAFGDAPKYLASRVMDWAKKTPTDRRVPEALFIVQQANGWTKYGCGSNEDLQNQLATILRKNYPSSEWTQKLIADEAERAGEK